MPRGSRRNIIRVLDKADAVDINEGRLAYFRYNEVLRNLADFYDVPFRDCVAAFAALSPNNDYLGNLRSTATLLKYFRTVPIDRIVCTTYNGCRDRAATYLTGTSFLGTVGGKKIRAFYSNILNPLDPAAVTIDGHAVNVWRNQRVNLQKVAAKKFRWKYDDVAADYRRAAAGVGLLPNQVQAITWFAWKRVNNILYPGRQFELYKDVSSDFWKTIVDPESIATFDPLPAGRIPENGNQQNNGRRNNEDGKDEARPEGGNGNGSGIAGEQRRLWRGRR
jgi:hypothetical protein